jgi:TetR/AcrR family transcriptional regulator, cholesterol catabolism regulator
MREKILSGAEELFMRYGVRSITMDEIARQLSISKKTIYQFFKDKDEIVLTITRGHLKCEMDDFESHTSGAVDAVDELVRLSLCIRKNMAAMNPAILYDLQKFHRESWEEWILFKNSFIKQMVVDNLGRGIKEGVFRPDIIPEVLATMRVELVQMSFDNRLFPSDKYPLSELQMQLFEHYVHGILTEKGRTLWKKYQSQLLQNPIKNQVP